MNKTRTTLTLHEYAHHVEYPRPHPKYLSSWVMTSPCPTGGMLGILET